MALTKIFDIAFEIDGDEISLEQDGGCGEVDCISLHRIHLRHLAEQAGLIPASAHASPDRVIARLARQLRELFDRIDRLDTWLLQKAEMGREDLTDEVALSRATCELASFFVEDFEAGAGALETQPKPTANPADSVACETPSNATKRQDQLTLEVHE